MKILVVEDERQIREGIISIIKTHLELPCKIKECTNGSSALSMSRDYYPDLVITDIIMPNYTGLELIGKLKEQRLCRHFIILSGHDNFSYAQQAIRFGVSDYLLKPLDRKDLLQAVRKVYSDLPNQKLSSVQQPLPDLDFFNWEPDITAMPPSLKKIWDYIQKNYMKEISLQTISEELFFHPSYISSLINKYTGHNFTYLLDYIRIRKAAALLLNEPDMSISELSYLVGYHNERRLYAAFQKRLNTTPGDFRKAYE